MNSTAELLAYARNLADELETEMTWHQEPGFGGFWKADEPKTEYRIAARAIGALEFLREYAGADSDWTRRARHLYDSQGDNQSRESGARAISDLLRGWASQAEAGIVEIAGARARAEISVVGTDLMSQVRRLLEDGKTHPAAAIVLCGAALEVALRALAEARNLELTERPSLGAFARLLRAEKVLSAQDVKDFDQCGGLRNLAAHGHFDELTSSRAGLLEQQTNLLLRRISDLHEAC